MQAVRNDTAIDDPKLNALSTFTRIMVESRGKPAPQELEAFLSAGYVEKNVLDIILAIAVKTISIYSNHFFHMEVDKNFKEQAWVPKTS